MKFKRIEKEAPKSLRLSKALKKNKVSKNREGHEFTRAANPLKMGLLFGV